MAVEGQHESIISLSSPSTRQSWSSNPGDGTRKVKAFGKTTRVIAQLTILMIHTPSVLVAVALMCLTNRIFHDEYYKVAIANVSPILHAYLRRW